MSSINEALIAEARSYETAYLVQAHGDVNSPFWSQADVFRRLAAALESVSPRLVTSVEELNALPVKTVLMDDRGWVVKRGIIMESDDDDDVGQTAWWITGSAIDFPMAAIALPVIVLWSPAPEGSPDPEEFCSICFAGRTSGEHLSQKCGEDDR